VQLAPRKSEWFHWPGQGTLLGTGEWIDLLAAHEGRHMVQFDHVNVGLTRIAGLLAGEFGVLGMSFFALPVWWWEGDGVVAETALTQGGRGRIPEFRMRMRTQLLSGTRYSYPKAVLGSFREWTPNAYELGYAMVAHVRKTRAADAWNGIVRRASKWSAWPFAFSQSVKKGTGRTLSRLYREAMDTLASAWGNRAVGLPFAEPTVLSPRPALHTEYLFPFVLEDGSVIAQKTGLASPWSLVRINGSGQEETLRQIRPLEPGASRASAAAGSVVWDEAIPDARWGARAYASIVRLDLRTGNARRIVSRCRWFNPALSPDAKRFVAVEYDAARRCALVVADAETGILIRRFPNPGNALLQAPSWAEDGRRIVFTFQNSEGKGITVLDTDDGTRIEALSPSWLGVSNPVLAGRYVLFSSPGSGIDNLHAKDLETGREFRITDVRYGAFSPQVSPDHERIVFAGYTPLGMAVCGMAFDPSSWAGATPASADPAGFVDSLTAQEGGPLTLPDPIQHRTYPARDYRGIRHLVQVHSWFIWPDPPETVLSLYSNNLLNTVALVPAVRVNANEKTATFEANGTYAGLYPLLHAGLSAGTRTARIDREGGQSRTDRWQENAVRFGCTVPWNLSRGVWKVSLEAGGGISYVHRITRRLSDGSGPGDGDFLPVNARIDFSRTRLGSVRDVSPPWFQRVSMAMAHTTSNRGMHGALASVKASLGLPGPWPHHSLQVVAAGEWQDPEDYRFASHLRFARGYAAEFHRSMAYGSVAYAFPILYPDWALGSLVYLKRVKGNGFYDYTLGWRNGVKKSCRSTGFELLVDVHFFNVGLPFEAGVRFFVTVDAGTAGVEPVVGFTVP
jgi:hypothetical protein